MSRLARLVGAFALAVAGSHSYADPLESQDATSLKMPPCDNHRDSYYPDGALARRLQGRVLVDVVINAKGRIISSGVKATDADPVLVAGARWYFSRVTCKVPSDWASRGGEGRHFLLSVTYILNNAVAPEPYKPNDGEVLVRGQVRERP